MTYQEDDHEIIDYGEVQLPGTELRVRGPLPRNLAEGGFVTALGAAQTFGRFVERTFPALLAENLGVDVLNLGLAGAGPAQFLKRPRALEIVNRSSLVIVQVLSGRSISNSHFENVNAGLLRPKSEPEAKPQHAEAAFRQLLETHDEEYIRRIVEESRRNYVQAFSRLLNKITAPKLLFWFSQRTPDYREQYDWLPRLFGRFPQLVNAEMMEALKPLADEYVECVTDHGLPQPLLSRFTGEPVVMFPTVDPPDANHYYPSPEMHLDAANALRDPVRRMLAGPAAAARPVPSARSSTSEPRPIFVVGSPRSGTSILTWCLGQHSNIAALPETLWVAGLGVGGELAYRQGFSSEHRLHLNVMETTEERFMQFLGRAMHEFILEEFDQFVERRSGQPADPTALRQWRRDPNVRQNRWIDGTPFNANYGLLLRRLFPEARFIHLVRRPDAVVRSLINFKKLPEAAKPERALWYWRHHVRMCRLLEDAYGSDVVLRVLYEDLLDDPEPTMHRMSAFLEEPFEGTMLLPLGKHINSSFATDEERSSAKIPKIEGLDEALELYDRLRAEANEPRAALGVDELEAEVERQLAVARLW